MTNLELWFHGIEVVILMLGVAAPVTWAVLRLKSILEDYPPHRHINGTILYPKGYEPSETQQMRGSTGD